MSPTTITYIGGPTAILEYAGLRIVTDPTFDAPGEYPDDDGEPLIKIVGPAIERSAIGPVDLVLLSHHEHEDNLDFAGRELLADSALTLSTTRAASDLVGLPIVGLDAWQSHDVGLVRVTAVPALHGPPGSEAILGPVIGFVVEAASLPTVYVSGDNASLPLVKQIADRFADIEIAVLFAGAARVPSIPADLTLNSADAAAAARILGAVRVVGLHTEDWAHFSESRADLEAAFAGTELLVATPRGVAVAL